MELSIKGKNVDVTDRLKEYVERKIGRLDRYLPTIGEAWVELSTGEFWLTVNPSGKGSSSSRT